MTGVIEFEEFQKIPRLKRACVITEKIDGTNAQIIITDDGQIAAASRSRLITPSDDNYGFAAWVEANRDLLLTLGPGRHFGEWWGLGIQRNYGQKEKRFSLFNTGRWNAENVTSCCSVVPVLYSGDFSTDAIDEAIADLKANGSRAAPGFMKPEGIIVFHVASRNLYKVTCEKDAEYKGKSNVA